MLPCLKEPAFVGGPLCAQGLQSVLSRSKISLPPAPLMHVQVTTTPYHRNCITSPGLHRISVAPKTTASRRPSLFHKHKCHRGLVQLGVYLLAPRAISSVVLSALNPARSAAIHPSGFDLKAHGEKE